MYIFMLRGISIDFRAMLTSIAVSIIILAGIDIFLSNKSF